MAIFRINFFNVRVAVFFEFKKYRGVVTCALPDALVDLSLLVHMDFFKRTDEIAMLLGFRNWRT